MVMYGYVGLRMFAFFPLKSLHPFLPGRRRSPLSASSGMRRMAHKGERRNADPLKKTSVLSFKKCNFHPPGRIKNLKHQ